MARAISQVADPFRSNATLEVLLVGEWNAGEFAELLSAFAMNANWQRAQDCREALLLLADGDCVPELIMLADPLPGTFCTEEVELLRRAMPLARLVVVAGTWCEGELRTGTPLPGVLRLYWYELPGWWAAAERAMQGSGCPPWSQPLDGPLAGRCLAGNEPAIAGNVAVSCQWLSTFEALAEALDRCGANCTWTRDGEVDRLPARVVAGIWDGGQLGLVEIERLKQFSQAVRQRGGIVVALLDFPRREHLQITHEAGCHAVFGKPYFVHELVSKIATLALNSEPPAGGSLE